MCDYVANGSDRAIYGKPVCHLLKYPSKKDLSGSVWLLYKHSLTSHLGIRSL